MSDFIQIGDDIICKAHIINIRFIERYAPHWENGKPYPKLIIETTGVTQGEYGTENCRYSYVRNQAVAVWETLQNYLAPTVIHLPDPIDPELIEIDASPTPVYVPVSDDDMPF